MMSRAWAVLVAGGLVLSASGGHGQEPGGAPAPGSMAPAMMEGDPAGCPCPSCGPRRPIHEWLANHCGHKADPDCDLYPKGHDLKGWLTYHSEAKGCCQHNPCCAPPLYTFFLDPHCGEGMGCGGSGCHEPVVAKEGGHHLSRLLFWRHQEKCPAGGPECSGNGGMVVQAPGTPQHP